MEKRLYRSKKNSIIAGVCGGIAEYLNVDPTVVRIVWILISFSGAGILAYIIAALIMPDRPEGTVEQYYGAKTGDGGEPGSNNRSADGSRECECGHSEGTRNIIGAALIVLGFVFLMKQFFHWFDMGVIASIALIAGGIVVITKGRGAR